AGSRRREGQDRSDKRLRSVAHLCRHGPGAQPTRATGGGTARGPKTSNDMSDASLIAVDIGNSSTKIGWGFESPAPSGLPSPGETKSFPTGQPLPDELRKALPKQPCRWRIASVHREGTRILQAWLETHRLRDEICVLTHCDLPLVI